VVVSCSADKCFEYLSADVLIVLIELCVIFEAKVDPHAAAADTAQFNIPRTHRKVV
jgi:hypothetical protein